jgi:hypothetical protein
MENITSFFAKMRASRLSSIVALALFFYTRGMSAIYAASEDIAPQVLGYDETLAGYMTRMVTALVLIGAIGFAAAKFLPRFFRVGSPSKLRLLGALNLGRDAVYILQTGPEVIALFVGKNSSTLLGKWSLDEWEDFEASSGESAFEGLMKKGNG